MERCQVVITIYANSNSYVYYILCLNGLISYRLLAWLHSEFTTNR